MSEKNKFYVYALIDPRNGEPFYIGKGCGNRARMHGRNSDITNNGKLERITAIRQAGLRHRVEILRADLTECDALTEEARLIAERRAALTNIVHGVGAPRSVSTIARRLLGRLKDEWLVRQEGDWPNGAKLVDRIRTLYECRAHLEALAYGD